MLSRQRPIAVVLAALTLAFAACNGGDETKDEAPELIEKAPTTTAPASSTMRPTTTPPTAPSPTQALGTVIEIEVVAGSPVGGVRRETVKLGDVVTLKVTSDDADEVHVHSYDEKAGVAPGTPAQLTFTANVPGVFEVELEKRHRKILDLEVRP